MKRFFLLAIATVLFLTLSMGSSVQAEEGYKNDTNIFSTNGPANALSTQPAASAAHTQIAAADYHSLAVKADGSLWSWGYNGQGQLGDGTTISQYAPVKVMDGVASVAAGGYHAGGARGYYSLAIKTDGSLWAWGYNGFGQLGDGTKTNRPTPVKVMDGAVSAAAGHDHALAVKSDGSLWAWGYNGDGQLGDGTETDQLIPVKIMDDVASVAAGGNHSLAVKSDGSLWAWGHNDYGQLGDGTAIKRLAPTKIMDDVANVATGHYYSLAIKTDGSLWALGNNEYGQLGDGTVASRLSPARIAEDVVSVVGGYHTLAVKADRSLWAWGYNDDRQLGDGTSARWVPTPAKAMDGVASVAAGGFHSLVVKSDGSLWAWGYNGDGEVGIGTTELTRDPVLVMPAGSMSANTATEYPITISPMANGSVTASHSTATAGTTVSVAVAPDAGYQLMAGSLTANGDAITGGSFIMPAQNVVIAAEFEQETITVADALAFTVDSKQAIPGERIEVPIRISNNPGVASIRIEVALHEDLAWDYDPAAYGSNPSTWPFVSSYDVLPMSGRPAGANLTGSFASLYFVGDGGNSIGDGTLAVLKLKIKDGASGGVKPITVNVATCKNESYADVPHGSVEPGIIAVVTPPKDPQPKYPATIINGDGSGEYEEGATVSIIAYMSTADQQFKEWTTASPGVVFADPSNASTSFTMPGNALSVTAVFASILNPATHYVVTYDLNGGTGAYVTFVAAQATGIDPPSGCRFKEWNTEQSGLGTSYAPGDIVTMTASDLSLYAIWESSAAYYAVTVDSDGTGASGNGDYEEGATVHISAGTPPEGQQFFGWTTTSLGVDFEDPSSANTSFTMPGNEVTVTAVFTYSIDVVIAAGSENANRAEFYTAGEATVQSTKLTSGNDPALYDSSGARIADDEAGYQHWRFAAASGTHYYAGTFGNDAATYTITSTAPITLVHNGDSQTPIPDQPYSILVSIADGSGNESRAEFYTTGESTVQSTNLTSGIDPALYDSSGTRIADDEAGGQHWRFAAVSGTHFYAGTFGNNAATYTITSTAPITLVRNGSYVDPTPTPTPTPAINQPYSILVSIADGSSNESRAEFYTTGTATVQSTNLTSGSDPALYDSSGTRIADDEAGSTHWRYTTTSGTYYYAGTYSNVAASYTIISTEPITLVRNGNVVDPTPTPPPTATPTPTPSPTPTPPPTTTPPPQPTPTSTVTPTPTPAPTPNQPYSIVVSIADGSSNESRAEFYTTGTATIQSTSLTSGSDPALYDSSGTRIADDEAGSAHWRYTTTSGTYYYSGTYSNGAASYTITSTAPITLVRNGVSTNSSYSISVTITAGSSNVSRAQFYTTGAATVQSTNLTSGSDPALYDAFGTRIADDEAGDSHWRYTTTSGKSYFAGTYSNVAASYTIISTAPIILVRLV